MDQDDRQTLTALIATLTAALTAPDDHEDLRETVARLEHLVMTLGTDIRALRLDVQEVRDRREGRQAE